ncbi:MAG TPA: MarR family transcriptional regulator [Streptosporangiaceae bacterium]|nr:MarR family transcriptional regulator [Streptosporangiaceae bacterium]
MGVPDRSREDQLSGELNICIMDSLGELFKRAAALGQGLAQRYGLSMTDLAGLHKLEEPMTMKELGQRLHCDPSFVTMVANSLEKHGLARRETSEQDKRIKMMRLTDEGVSMRERLEKEFSTRMPWATALSTGERECLLAMLRRLVAAAIQEGTGPDCMSPDDETVMTGGDTATN